MLNSSNFAMIPLSYCIHLAGTGQREKMRQFAEYCLDYAAGRTNSVRFYAESWGIGKTKAGQLCKEFKQEITEFYQARIEDNEKHYQKVADKTRTKREKNADIKTDTKTTVKSGIDEDLADTKTDRVRKNRGQGTEKPRTKNIERKKEKKENNTHTLEQHKEKKVCVSTSSYSDFPVNKQVEEWIKEKSSIAHNPYAYAAKIRKAYANNEPEALEEFEMWLKQKQQQEQAEQEEQQTEQIEHADFSIFIENPQILQHYLGLQKIKYVLDSMGSTLDIYFEDHTRMQVAKSQLYSILRELQQQGGAA